MSSGKVHISGLVAIVVQQWFPFDIILAIKSGKVK
jgi:hypothetical protein